MLVDLDTAHGEDFAEVGRVDDVDFQEDHVGAVRDWVVATLFLFLGGVLDAVTVSAGSAACGDPVELAVVGEGVGDEPASVVCELDA